MNNIAKDLDQECFICRVEGGCQPGHIKCGISKGIKLGIYPEDSHRAPAKFQQYSEHEMHKDAR